MDIPDATASEFDLPTSPDASYPVFEVQVATVSVVDGIWQDQPDNVAAFIEARLGELARGRGNLYICLDVSGEVEGRSDLERALIEVIRDTYASSRGSISFALSEGLRAANAHLYESNRQVSREARRMAGVSAVILRGNDLYIAQAGPAVVYVEASEKLARYPTESDWFVEDAPMIAPQGAASAPLGIRREFVSDLAHASVSAGDVFALATRALTQLATTEDLAIAFTERTAMEIGSYLEELGEDADVTALIAELADPHAATALDDSTESDAPDDSHIESLPVPLKTLVSLDESEPPVDDDAEEFEDEEDGETEWEASPTVAETTTESEQELNWDEEETDDQEPLKEEPETETDSQPVYAAAAAAAAIPIFNQPTYTPNYTRPEPPPVPPSVSNTPPVTDATFASNTSSVSDTPYVSNTARTSAPPPQPTDAEWAAELERRRAERAVRRTAQKEDVTRVAGGFVGTIMMLAGMLGGAIQSVFGSVDWDSTGKRTNRFLNMGVGALISFFLLLVRLVLPGAMPRNTSLIPRRATSDPVWLKALAIVLPILFIALASFAYLNRQIVLERQFDELVAQADATTKQAEVNPDKVEARKQFNTALKQIKEAQAIQDSPKAKLVLYRIQNQLSELDGIAVLYTLSKISQVSAAQFKQVAASDQDVFLLDGRGRVYKYLVNDTTGVPDPSAKNGVLLQTGSKIDDETIDNVLLFTVATPQQDKAALVGVSKNAILTYDLEGDQWRASPVNDSDNWGELRTIASFGGNIYLLDSKKNQIYRYTPTANGYADKGVAYFPANALPVLSKAVDMAIDGDIWVLNDNGTVLRFRAGSSIPFDLGSLDVPLKNPVAIFTRPEVDSIYIADSGNQRIVEFDKNGAFVRQFKPSGENGDAFKSLRDFTVNETRRKLYFVNPDAAYMTYIPK